VADEGTSSKIVTVGGLTRQSSVAGGVTGVRGATVVVVGNVVPEAWMMLVGGSKLRSGSTGASRSPEHDQRESASKPASSSGSVRMRGSVVRCIPGRGIPYEGRTAGRQLREKLSTGGESGLQAPYTGARNADP